MTSGETRPIKVTLADDHPIVLAGIRALLQGVAGITLVGEANDGDAALALVKQTMPDVAVFDLSMPGTNGVELVQRIVDECPGVRIIALTVHEDGAYVQRLVRAGARGYLLKRSAAEGLARAIMAVAEGGMYLDPAIADKALGDNVVARSPAPEVELSRRETDVLRLTAQGFSNKEISAQLNVSVKSIETYKARALEKLDLHTRAEIIRYGVGRGWLDELG